MFGLVHFLAQGVFFVIAGITFERATALATGALAFQRAVGTGVAGVEGISPAAFAAATGMTAGQGLLVGAAVAIVVGLINEAAFGNVFVRLLVGYYCPTPENVKSA